MSLADLTTEEIALFQLIEQGFVGISNGVTLIRAEDARTTEANYLNKMINDLLDKSEAEEYIDTGEALSLLTTCKAFLEQYPENPSVAVLVAFKPGIEMGSFQVEPVARLLTNPSEVINPQFEHTDGAGNVKGDNGVHDNSPKPSGSKGNGANH